MDSEEARDTALSPASYSEARTERIVRRDAHKRATQAVQLQSVFTRLSRLILCLVFFSVLPAGEVQVSCLCELIPLSILSFSAALLSYLNFRMCACFSLFGCILAASVHFPTLQSPSWEYVAALSRACFVVRTWACRRSKPGPEYISCCPPTQRLSVGPYLGRAGRSRFLVVKRSLSCAGKWKILTWRRLASASPGLSSGAGGPA